MTNSNILIVFALNEEFVNFCDILKIKITDKDAQNIYNCHIRTENNGYLFFYSYCFPDKGSKSVYDNLPKILKQINPSIVINIGISGRIRESLSIGDVVIGDFLYSVSEDFKLIDDENNSKENLYTTKQNSTSTKLNEICLKFSSKDYLSLREKYIPVNFSKDEIQSFNSLCPIPKFVQAPIISVDFVSASEIIKKKYLTINRKMGVVEMEAYAIQDVIDIYNKNKKKFVESLIVKGISDYADLSKQDDFRKFAMFNSLMIVKNFLNNIKLSVINRPFEFSDINEIFNENHLSVKQQYDRIKDKVSFKDFEITSRFFSFLIVPPNNQIISGDIFKGIDLILNKDNNIYSIKFCGFSGSGKTSLLISVYNYLIVKFSTEKKLFPIYINLEYYYDKFDDRNKIDLETFVRKSFELDIHLAEKIIKNLSPDKIVLIVDGIDQHRDSPELLDYINHLIKIANYNIKKVIGIQFIPEKTILNSSYARAKIISNLEIHFRDLNFDDIYLSEFITSYLEYCNCDVDSLIDYKKKIIDFIKMKKLQNIDFFILSLLLENIDNIEEVSIFEMIHNYCIHSLSNTSINIDYLSQISYKHHIIRKDGDTIVFQNLSTWKLIHQNPQIAYYLIAKEVIDNILSINDANDNTLYKELSFVYPHQINYFCKEILNQDRFKQENIFSKIKIILQCRNWHSIAVACYLAGRLSDKILQDLAKNLLMDFLEEISLRDELQEDMIIEEYDKFLFALRTIYISLTYLGETDYEQIYIDRLIEDKTWDDINRGFHLVYYGDQEYNPSFGLAQKDYLEDFHFTFDQLLRRLSNTKRSNLYNIELFTLLSLVVKRINSKHLTNSQIEQIKNLLNNTQTFSRISGNCEVTNFALYVKEVLNEPSFTVFSPFIEIVNLKFIDRSGWIKRKISSPESVASHTLFSYFLASYYLPEESVEEEYDKNTILNMLLIHDLAESKYGDQISKSEGDKSDEIQFFEKFKWISYILPKTNRLVDFYDLWNDFENGISINGKIAKEIDKLEAYLQLLYYKYIKNEDISSEQLSEWRRDFEGNKKLKNKEVEDIFNMAEFFFNKMQN